MQGDRDLEDEQVMTPAVVVGLNLNGLGTVRSLGRVGIPVVALAGGNRHPCEFTRYCKVVTVPNLASDEEALLESLERVGRSLPSRAVVFPAGDQYLLAISRNLLPDIHPGYILAGIRGQPTAAARVSSGAWDGAAQEARHARARLCCRDWWSALSAALG